MTKRLFEDTDEATERRLIKLARNTPLWEKFQQVSDTRETTKRFAMMGLRRRYPQATEEELRKRLAAIFLDREIVVKVYGWDPEVEGY
jgi:hypothetical protein